MVASVLVFESGNSASLAPLYMLVNASFKHDSWRIVSYTLLSASASSVNISLPLGVDLQLFIIIILRQNVYIHSPALSFFVEHHCLDYSRSEEQRTERTQLSHNKSMSGFAVGNIRVLYLWSLCQTHCCHHRNWGFVHSHFRITHLTIICTHLD